MKIGDIVKINNGCNPCRGTTHWLYGGDEKCWDDRNSLISTDIAFGFGDLGLVLKKKKKMVRGYWYYIQSYVKILTPRGIGWIFENAIEVVKTQRNRVTMEL